MDGTALQEHAGGEPAEPARAEAADEAGTASRRRWSAQRTATGWVPTRVVRRVTRHAHDAGMATAEYAIATLAAVGFAGLLVVILKGNEVKGLLGGIIKQALSL